MRLRARACLRGSPLLSPVTDPGDLLSTLFHPPFSSSSPSAPLSNACGLYVQTHGRMRPLAALGARKKAEAQAAKAKGERAALPDGGVRPFAIAEVADGHS